MNRPIPERGCPRPVRSKNRGMAASNPAIAKTRLMADKGADADADVAVAATAKAPE